MVYLSHPTEYGTLYSRKELQAISEICRSYEIPLYLDGARLGYGLAGEENDLSLSEIAHLCDVFYIGGTKVGAFCGEAVVFGEKKNVPAHFITRIKQQARCWQRDACWESSLTCCLQTAVRAPGTPCGRDGGGFKERVKTARLYVFP